MCGLCTNLERSEFGKLVEKGKLFELVVALEREHFQLAQAGHLLGPCTVTARHHRKLAQHKLNACNKGAPHRASYVRQLIVVEVQRLQVLEVSDFCPHQTTRHSLALFSLASVTHERRTKAKNRKKNESDRQRKKEEGRERRRRTGRKLPELIVAEGQHAHAGGKGSILDPPGDPLRGHLRVRRTHQRKISK